MPKKPDLEAESSRNELESAVEFVIRGKPTLPVAEIGMLRFPKGSAEANRCREITSILREYAGRKVGRPLSIAVFGPPGSGKSFCVAQIAFEAGCRKPVQINLSQLTAPKELAEALQKEIELEAKKIAAEMELADTAPVDPGQPKEKAQEVRTTRVFFFDEFDTALNRESLGWLRWFLAPMQDGKLFLKGRPIELEKAVFIFAGGTAVSLSEFEKRALQNPDEYRDKKVPDFISRLRGFIDIEGINSLDKERPIRRALMLHLKLDERWPGARRANGSVFPIDREMVRGLLSNVHFIHGVRSMEALLDMSRLDGQGGPLVRLPDNELRKLHLSRGLLDGKVIGISSGQTDSEAKSLLKDLTEKLLLNGAILAYGGDFVPAGTLSMVVEAAALVPDDLVKRSDKRIRNYLPFPSFHRDSVRKQLEEEKNKEEKDQRVEFLELHTLSDAERETLGVTQEAWFRARDEKKSADCDQNRHLAWAISLFRMRARLVQDIDALIVLGGKDDGKSWGRFSGIAEEVMLACALRKPVYVLGGRGGGAKAVGRLLGLDETIANPGTCLADDEAGTPFALEINANYFTLPSHPKLPQTTGQIRTFLFEHGITTRGWPGNGLNLTENRELFRTPINGNAAGDDSRKKCVDLIIAGLLRLDWTLSARPPLG